ncbi:MAG: antitoxin MazE family protein [Pseudorhodoplanes sp.]|nr:antitoxin MazE family protein [Pseudorhodoplanes sp.]
MASDQKSNRRPLTSREKVAAHRARMRAQGLRPVTIWVPDPRAREFSEEAKRQAKAIAASADERAEIAFIERISWWKPSA